MKKIICFLTAMNLISFVHAQTLDRSIRPQAGPPPEIKMGNTESFTLDNGLKVFVVENHKLPTVNYSIQFDIQPELNKEMTGLQDLIGDLARAGTKSKNKETLNNEIDYIGAHIAINEDGGNAYGLKKHNEKLLALFSDVLINADFKQKELDLLKTKTNSELEAAKNNPDAMSRNIVGLINFGANHPYGRVTTKESNDKITLEACKKYYATYFRPNVAYLAVVGDITKAEIKPLLEKYFGKWEKTTVPKFTYNAPTGKDGKKVTLSVRNAAVQSVVNVTYPIDLKPGTADVIKLQLANTILGGGSQGRLFLNLREAHSWTYGAYSSVHPDEIDGSFSASAKCRNIATDSAISEIISEMRRMGNEIITKQEMKNCINYVTGNFSAGLENPQTIAQYAINLERFKMPKDYYQNYLKTVASITPEDIQQVSKNYLNPDKANIIVVGAPDMEKKLSRFGNVDVVDNYGNPIIKKTIEPVKSNITAAQIYDNYITALGGEKIIKSIKDIKIVRTAEMQKGMKISFTEFKSKNQYKQLVESSDGTVLRKLIYKKGKGFDESRGQRKELEAGDLMDVQEKADIQADLNQENIIINVL